MINKQTNKQRMEMIAFDDVVDVVDHIDNNPSIYLCLYIYLYISMYTNNNNNNRVLQ